MGYEDVSGAEGGCGVPALENEISGGSRARPHSFPWVVRLIGGCPRGLCGATLITTRHILTSFHCTYYGKAGPRPCDHSDGRRLAVLGLDTFVSSNLPNYYSIPVIDIKYPPHAQFTLRDLASHDFAMGLLKEPAVFSATVAPICLPRQGDQHGGLQAVAAGWGRFTTPNVWPYQSKVLRRVVLRVSPKRYRHSAMLGTMLERNQEGVYKDPCRGDSGGPLMYRGRDRWVIIGTVYGGGYDCKTGKTSTFEGSINGLWNRVSAHTDWIKATIQPGIKHTWLKRTSLGNELNEAAMAPHSWMAPPLMAPQQNFIAPKMARQPRHFKAQSPMAPPEMAPQPEWTHPPPSMAKPPLPEPGMAPPMTRQYQTLVARGWGPRRAKQ